MHRLFVAIRPPRTVREPLLDLMEALPPARWQDGEQLHLTLRFIGAVDRPTAEDIAAALGGVRHGTFEIAVDGVGRFERNGRTAALWAGVSPRTPLEALHRKIDHALVRAGFAPERRAYLPHITLARFGRGGGDVETFLARHAGLAGPRFPVSDFVLFESHLGKGGARYEAVARYPLTARD